MPRGMPPCCRAPVVSEPSFPVPFGNSSFSEQRTRLLDSIQSDTPPTKGDNNASVSLSPEDPNLSRDVSLLCDAARLCRLVYRSPESATLLWERAHDQSHSPEEMDNDPEVMRALRSVVSQPECVEAHDEFLDVCAYLFAYVPGATSAETDLFREAAQQPQQQQQQEAPPKPAGSPRLIVAFRGAASLEDALCGGGGAPQAPLRTGNLRKGGSFPPPRDAMVHQGFLSQFRLLEPLLDSYVLNHLRANRRHRLLCCGHSLGGAVAGIAAVVYGTMYPGQVEWVSFGAPKIGNNAFADAMHHKVSLRWRVKHGRDLVVKVPAGDFAYCGHELHCGRDDPYPDIPVFQDLPDHDSIRYIEALDALAHKAHEDLLAFPLSLVGALSPARGLAVVMNELFKAWLYWSGVGAQVVGMQLPGQGGAGGSGNGNSGSPNKGPLMASTSEYRDPRSASGSFRGGLRQQQQQQQQATPAATPMSQQQGAGGSGSHRGGFAGGASGSRRAASGQFAAPPASRGSTGSRVPTNSASRSVTGRG